MKKILITIIMIFGFVTSSMPTALAAYVFDTGHTDERRSYASRNLLYTQFSLSHPTRITSIEGWLSGIRVTNDLSDKTFLVSLSVYGDATWFSEHIPNIYDIKFSMPVKVPSSSFNASIVNDFDWRGVKDINVVLPAGSYWVGFHTQSLDSITPFIGHGFPLTSISAFGSTNDVLPLGRGQVCGIGGCQPTLEPPFNFSLRIGGESIFAYESPVANAGQDVVSPAQVKIILDGSDSHISTGTSPIIEYRWVRLFDGKVLCNTSTPICETTTLGLAEEVVELTVFNRGGAFGKDRMSIYHVKQAVCGNENVDEGEVCDGNRLSCLTAHSYTGNKYCNGTCSGFGDCLSGQYCGDGVINGIESCDDGNSTPGDGCSGNCLIETAPSQHTWIEAEAANAIVSPLKADNDALAAGGRYVYSLNTATDAWAPNSVAATYNVNVATAGVYVLWGRVIAPNGNEDSFYAQVDSGTNNVWDLPIGTVWSWSKVTNRNSAGVVSPAVFNLTAGAHTIKIKLREAGAKIDKLLLTKDQAYVPTGLGL